MPNKVHENDLKFKNNIAKKKLISNIEPHESKLAFQKYTSLYFLNVNPLKNRIRLKVKTVYDHYL